MAGQRHETAHGGYRHTLGMPGGQGSEGRLGALAERNYRLLFASTLVTSIGDAVALVSLAFAVLAVTDATGLGLVLAVRQATSAAVLLFGGVLSDRLPRQGMLAAASLAQGAAQGAMAVLAISGRASLAAFAGLSVLWGCGNGIVVPAEAGLVPETVSAARLQQANALQGLSRSGVRVLGPAVGGALVVTVGAGWALAVDAVSFLACAALLIRIGVPPRRTPAQRFVAELREGWRLFAARTWLWSTVLLYGVANLFGMFWQVLGPAVAKEHLGGAAAWSLILTASGLGLVAGGLWALRHHPRRPMVACIVWSLLNVPMFAALALGAPTWVVAAAAAVGGAGLAVHLTLWFTVFQREVPVESQSRVAAFDAFGSFVLVPIGAAIAGPAAAAIGAAGALWLAAGAIAATHAAMLAIPSVWVVGRPRT